MRSAPAVRPSLALGFAGPFTLACIATLGIALVVQRYSALPALGVLVILLVAGALVQRPHAATVITAFLLYVNFPAMLTKQLGMPAALAGSFLLLLLCPLLYLVFVQRERLRIDVTFGLMLAFIGVLAIGSLRAVDLPTATARVLQFALEGLLIYWLFVNVIRTQVVLRRVILTVITAGAFVSSLSLYQEVTGSYQQEFGGLAYRNYTPEGVEKDEGAASVHRRSSYRAQGPTDEPNRFAQILIVLLPLAVFSHRSASSAAARKYVLITGLLILTGTVLTLSRGAFLNLVLLAGVMAALRWIRPLHLAAAFLALALLVPVVAPRAVPRMLSIVNARYLAADDPAVRAGADGAIRGRTTSMLTALHVFRDHPWIGVGPGQFRFYYSEYSDNPDIRYRAIQGPRRAHSLYLEMGAEMGVAGLAVFLAIVLGLVNRLWKLRRFGTHASSRDLATAMVLSIAAYLGTGVFLHLSYQRYLWFMIALAGAALHVLSAELRAVEAPDPLEARVDPRIPQAAT